LRATASAMTLEPSAIKNAICLRRAATTMISA
jgi:hypothetical protein